jgi:hypothetical protein
MHHYFGEQVFSAFYPGQGASLLVLTILPIVAATTQYPLTITYSYNTLTITSSQYSTAAIVALVTS